MKVSEVMTSMPIAVTSRDTVMFAAELMRHERIGSLPVVAELAHRRLVGIITDRDITVRCVAPGHGGRCTVGAHMTRAPLHTVQPDDDVSDVVARMARAKVRRIPVVVEDDAVVGIVTATDLACRIGSSDALVVQEVLEAVGGPVADSA